MSWKEAQGIVAEAKNGLSLPNWGEAALRGQNPAQAWKDLTSSLQTMGDWKSVFPAIGDAGMLSKESQFLSVMDKFPNIANLPSVVRWTTIAHAAKVGFYISTGIGTGVDLFDKSSGFFPHIPVLQQWNDLKDWATTGSGGG